MVFPFAPLPYALCAMLLTLCLCGEFFLWLRRIAIL
jgi:hypothetical protein